MCSVQYLPSTGLYLTQHFLEWRFSPAEHDSASITWPSSHCADSCHLLPKKTTHTHWPSTLSKRTRDSWDHVTSFHCSMVQFWCSHAHCKHFRHWTGVIMGAESCPTRPDVTNLTQPMVWVWDKTICLFEQFQAEENVRNSIWYYTLHLEKQKEIENWSSKTALRCLV